MGRSMTARYAVDPYYNRYRQEQYSADAYERYGANSEEAFNPEDFYAYYYGYGPTQGQQR